MTQKRILFIIKKNLHTKGVNLFWFLNKFDLNKPFIILCFYPED